MSEEVEVVGEVTTGHGCEALQLVLWHYKHRILVQLVEKSLTSTVLLQFAEGLRVHVFIKVEVGAVSSGDFGRRHGIDQLAILFSFKFRTVRSSSGIGRSVGLIPQFGHSQLRIIGLLAILLKIDCHNFSVQIVILGSFYWRSFGKVFFGQRVSKLDFAVDFCHGRALDPTAPDRLALIDPLLVKVILDHVEGARRTHASHH